MVLLMLDGVTTMHLDVCMVVTHGGTIKYNYIKVKPNMINYCEYCVGVNERVCVTLNCSSDMTRR